MILRMTLALSLTVLAACAAETSPTTDQTGTQPGASTGTSGGTSGSPTGGGGVYSVSCNGEISKPASASAEIAPKCIGGPPGANDCGGGTSTTGECAPQDVKFHYAPPALRCIGVDVFEWNGKDCVAHNTHGEGGMLKCQGKDCEKLFKTKDACEAHRRGCEVD